MGLVPLAGKAVKDFGADDYMVVAAGADIRRVATESVTGFARVSSTGLGVIDETVAIQAAIDRAVAANKRLIHLPGGYYRTTAPLTGHEDIVFVGDGRITGVAKVNHYDFAAGWISYCCDLFVDSVNGSDSYDGLTWRTPKKSLAGVADVSFAGAIIGLAAGSVFNELFPSGITGGPSNSRRTVLMRYGSGPNPVIKKTRTVTISTVDGSTGAMNVLETAFNSSSSSAFDTPVTSGAGSATTFSANSSDIGSPSGWSSTAFRATVTTSGTSYYAYVAHTADIQGEPRLYGSFEVAFSNLSGVSATTWSTSSFFEIETAGAPLIFMVRNQGGTLRFGVVCPDYMAGNIDAIFEFYLGLAVATNTRYTISWRLDHIANVFEAKVNGTTIYSGQVPVGVGAPMELQFGANPNPYYQAGAFQVYFQNLKLDTRDYPASVGSYSLSNVRKATLTGFGSLDGNAAATILRNKTTNEVAYYRVSKASRVTDSSRYYHNTGTGEIFVYATAAADWEIPDGTSDTIDKYGTSNWAWYDINVEGSRGHGWDMRNGQNITLKRCRATLCGKSAFYFADGYGGTPGTMKNLRIEQCEGAWTRGSGINFAGIAVGANTGDINIYYNYFTMTCLAREVSKYDLEMSYTAAIKLYDFSPAATNTCNVIGNFVYRNAPPEPGNNGEKGLGIWIDSVDHVCNVERNIVIDNGPVGILFEMRRGVTALHICRNNFCKGNGRCSSGYIAGEIQLYRGADQTLVEKNTLIATRRGQYALHVQGESGIGGEGRSQVVINNTIRNNLLLAEGSGEGVLRYRTSGTGNVFQKNATGVNTAGMIDYVAADNGYPETLYATVAAWDTARGTSSQGVVGSPGLIGNGDYRPGPGSILLNAGTDGKDIGMTG